MFLVAVARRYQIARPFTIRGTEMQTRGLFHERCTMVCYGARFSVDRLIFGAPLDLVDVIGSRHTELAIFRFVCDEKQIGRGWTCLTESRHGVRACICGELGCFASIVDHVQDLSASLLTNAVNGLAHSHRGGELRQPCDDVCRESLPAENSGASAAQRRPPLSSPFITP